MKILKIYIVLVLFLLIQCTSTKNNPNELILTNDSYMYNCGKKELIIKDKKIIDSINNFAKNMVKDNDFTTSISVNSGSIVVDYDDKDFSYQSEIKLMITEDYGYVFCMPNSLFSFYRNDEFAKYLINLMEIQDSYFSYNKKEFDCN